MKRKTELSDFDFYPNGYGHYKVIYTSPMTRKQWQVITNDMPLIDATRNADEPLRKDLDALKWLCKNRGYLRQC